MSFIRLSLTHPLSLHSLTHSPSLTHSHVRARTSPGCTRFFQKRKWRLTHERRGDKCSGGLSRFRLSRTATTRDTNRGLLINQAIAEAHTDGLVRARPQKKRRALMTGEIIVTPHVTGEYQSYVTGNTYTVSTPERGCLMKHTITSDPLDDDQIKFLAWA